METKTNQTKEAESVVSSAEQVIKKVPEMEAPPSSRVPPTEQEELGVGTSLLSTLPLEDLDPESRKEIEEIIKEFPEGTTWEEAMAYIEQLRNAAMEDSDKVEEVEIPAETSRPKIDVKETTMAADLEDPERTEAHTPEKKHIEELKTSCNPIGEEAADRSSTSNLLILAEGACAMGSKAGDDASELNLEQTTEEAIERKESSTVEPEGQNRAEEQEIPDIKAAEKKIDGQEDSDKTINNSPEGERPCEIEALEDDMGIYDGPSQPRNLFGRQVLSDESDQEETNEADVTTPPTNEVVPNIGILTQEKEWLVNQPTEEEEAERET